MCRSYESLNELPEIVEPGCYVVAGMKIDIYEPVERDVLKRIVEKAQRILNECPDAEFI